VVHPFIGNTALVTVGVVGRVVSIVNSHHDVYAFEYTVLS